LGLVGNEFGCGNDEICGIVISIRDHDILSVWNKTAMNQEIRYKIRDTLIRILKLPPGTIMEYKTHNESLKDNSSFRNTETYKC
jgi:translation initiation factor 4E